MSSTNRPGGRNLNDNMLGSRFNLTTKSLLLFERKNIDFIIINIVVLLIDSMASVGLTSSIYEYDPFAVVPYSFSNQAFPENESRGAAAVWKGMYSGVCERWESPLEKSVDTNQDRQWLYREITGVYPLHSGLIR